MKLKTTKLRDAIAFALIAGATSAAGMGTALAQQTPEDETTTPGQVATPTTTTDLDRIQVTGTRIKRTEFEPTQPTTMVDNEYIELRGLQNAQQAVTQLPGVFNAASPTIAGSNAPGQGIGQRLVDLYGLGSQRTLTLVNGGRFVSSNSPVGGAGNAGSQVDLNNIPTALIDRVEVVKVGGAPVYGSDAVAGVINFILRRDYEGAEFSYDVNSIGGGLGIEHTTRALFGGNFDNDRGNIVLAVEHNKAPDILSKNVPSRRDNWTRQTPSVEDRVLRENGTWPTNQVRMYARPSAGILSFTGLVSPSPLTAPNLGVGGFPDGSYWHFGPNGNLTPFDIGRRTGNQLWAEGGDGLDLIATEPAQVGYERWNLTGIANYALTDDINMSLTTFSNRLKGYNTGFQAYYSSGAFGGHSAALRFNTNHPFLNDAARAQLEDLLGGPGDFYLHRGWLEMGDQGSAGSNDTYVNSIRVGFDGSFEVGERFWDWEVSAQRGWSRTYRLSNEVAHNRWWAAMDVGINPSTGQLDCRYNYEPGYGSGYRPTGPGVSHTNNPLGAVGSCVPFNPFNPGGPSQASMDYISFWSQARTDVDQKIFNGYISGDLFELPAGAFGVAFGVESRTESAAYYPSGTDKLAGWSDTTISGGYRSDDAYVEFYAPITSAQWNLPGIYSLSFEGSYRQLDNSRSGSDDSWAIGLNWRPFEDLVLRANRANTVRAPAVTELFLPVVQTRQFAADPCHGPNLGNGPNPSIRQANCAAEGIPTTFTSQAVVANRGGWTGGNVNLTNEQATSLNFGILYAPSFAPGLEISADYVEIDIEDAIVSFTLTNIMEACYDASDYPNRFCDMFVRGADHQLPNDDAFTSGYVNAALRRLRAMEYAVAYTLPTDSFGTFRFDLRAYNLKENVTSNTGFDNTDTTGQFNNPKWRGTLNIMHRYGDLTTYMDINYQQSGVINVYQTEPLQYIDENGVPFSTLPSITTANIGASYNILPNVTVRGGIQNLFDWFPNTRERSSGRWTYGRSYTLGITAKF